jgi:hypothetical protein
MDTQEFINYVEIEGLEYYLVCKNTDWHYLTDEKLLKQCHKLVKASEKINRIIREYKAKMPHEK